MTIDEAIKEIEIAISYAHFTPYSRQESALRLGIEALKRVGAYRRFPDRGPGALLSGETEE